MPTDEDITRFRKELAESTDRAFTEETEVGDAISNRKSPKPGPRPKDRSMICRMAANMLEVGRNDTPEIKKKKATAAVSTAFSIVREVDKQLFSSREE